MSARVAFVLPSLEGGGVQRVILNLATGFLHRGFEVDLVLVAATGPLRRQVPARVRVIDLGAGRVLRAVPGLVRYLRRVRPAALLASQTHVNVAALWARRLAGIRVRAAVGEHGHMSTAIRHVSWAAVDRLRPLGARWFYPWADAVVAVSRKIAEDLADVARLPLRSIRVIHNPVMAREIRRQAEAAPDHPWFAPGQPPVLVSVGRLAPEKAYETLVRAFAALRARRVARLAILGEGPERPRLEALVRDLRLADEIWLPGYVENPWIYMARSQAFVLSSVREGFPNVLTEALACGTPVVSTDCPSGPAEILDGGRYGRLVPVGDVAALARAVEATLVAPPAREDLVRRAEAFSLETATDQYLELLCP